MSTQPPRPLIALGTNELLARVLAGQSDLNQSVSRALEASALSQERYETELAELRGRLAILEGIILILLPDTARDHGLHSVKV